MKLTQAMIVVLPAYLLLSACGAKPDPSSIQHNPSAPVVTTADQSAAKTTPEAAKSPAAQTTNVADLQAEKAQLEAQKADLQNQQKDMQAQKASFAQPGGMNQAAFGDFMAGAQALPVAIDQAKLDKIIQAAMDGDLDALQKAVEDLLADLQKALDDLQAQIDDVAAQIEAAQP